MKFEKPKKKTIEWHGKKVSVPFDCQIYPEKKVTIANRFSGQETTMPGYAAAVYDTIIGAGPFFHTQHFILYQLQRKRFHVGFLKDSLRNP